MEGTIMPYFELENKKIILKSLNNQYLDKFDELKYLLFFKEYFKNNKNINIIDCGANVGSYSIFFSLFLNCNKIYSIEPFNKIYEILKDNIVLNDCKNIELINKGVASKKSEIILISEIPKNKGAFWFWYNELNEKDIENHRPFNIGYKEHSSIFNSNIIAECNTLDSIINTTEKIHFIKIDVEGMEIEALSGAKNIIDCNKPLLYVEGSLKTMNHLEKWIIDNKYNRVNMGLFKKHHYLLEPINENSSNR